MTVRFRTRELTLAADDVRALVDEARRRDAPFATQRERFRQSLMRRAYDRYTGGVAIELDEHDFGVALLADARVAQGDRRLLAQREPGRARAFVADPTRVPGARRERACCPTTSSARSCAARRAAEAWTADDLPLIDEAEAFVKGAPRRFGHVVVDEAQDLSPMQLRMLARRAHRHSMTVLGDLAQATGPASPDELGGDARASRPARRTRSRPSSRWATGCRARSSRSRTGCCRSPRRESRRRARCAPTAIRPTSHEFAPEQLVAGDRRARARAREGVRHRRRDRGRRRASTRCGARSKTAVSCSPSRARSIPTARSSCCRPGLAKGLEFDAVIVAEPAEIAAEEPHGVRLLFVALTRAVQHLALAHAQPLPRCWRDGRCSAGRTRAARARVGWRRCPSRRRCTSRPAAGTCGSTPTAGTELSVEGGIDRAPRRRHACTSGVTPSASSIEVRCATGHRRHRRDRLGQVDLVGPLGAVRVATVSGTDPRRGGGAHRRAHEVGQDRHRHVRGRVPGHDQELGGARRQRGAGDRRGRLRRRPARRASAAPR